MSEKRFCPNCGTKLENNVEFCPNCGFKLAIKHASPSRQAYQQTVKKQGSTKGRQAYHAQPMKKKTKVLLTLGVAFLAVFTLFYAWGSNHYSKENQINRIKSDLIDTKTGLAKDVVADDSAMQVTDAALKPTQTYFAEHHKAANELINYLKEDASFNRIHLVQSGRHLLLFPRYVLRVPTIYATVATNHSSSSVTINGKYIGHVKRGSFDSEKQDNKYGVKLKRLFVGTYHIKVKSNISGRNLSTTSNYDLWSSGTVDMGIRTESFTVKSTPGAILYLNDQKAGTLNKKGQLTFKDYPVTDKLKIYVKAKVGNNTIKSQEMNYGDVQYDDANDSHKTIEPKWDGLIAKEDAQQILEDNFKDPDEDAFVNGAENKSYQELRKMDKGYDEDDDIDSYDMSCSVISVSPAPNKSSNIVYKITFTFEVGDTERKQVLLYKGASFRSSGSDNESQKIKSIGTGKIVSDKKY
ncbi:zinc-ribbon domain-containing protein [Lactobacillus sp. M0398]|uniref:zinc ribbon domain-containing protein n=1 Tax=unclassified Lactobacillus TaxID=2620435 RepID=UPI0018DCADB7|nr:MULTISPECIES: zinc-ribbon domain-containing protein [unclassified Lactobacillus]MBI0121386.1 zinc-ribbon domain-containing protein [Lactobacillus sp. M0398]MBI0123533.1 zinc-ribbon domain-containing protein [Lactobacillus sp. W8174]MBI0135837.1 zinc-ribbon domain-containing protein [Lactobacillus sp. W8173]